MPGADTFRFHHDFLAIYIEYHALDIYSSIMNRICSLILPDEQLDAFNNIITNEHFDRHVPMRLIICRPFSGKPFCL